MAKEPALLLTVFAGGLIAMQAPINSMLGKSVGTFAAASVSFVVGTVALVLITVLVGGGFGEVGEARHLPWYYLTGGLLGAVYVTTALVAVRSLGAGGVTAATIAGQLTLSLADRPARHPRGGQAADHVGARPGRAPARARNLLDRSRLEA